MKRGMVRIAACAGVLGACSPALGQSLFQRAVELRSEPGKEPDTHGEVRVASLMFVEKPKPKDFAVHDQVTIIIDERSTASSEQTLDTKKDYDFNAALTKFPSLQAFLEGQIENGDSNTPAELAIKSKNKFKGEGEYERTDRFSARITAEVIDVKPNGVLVLEARKTIKKDEEAQTLVLSGNVRKEDVTDANTVLSTQLADLTIVSKNEGRVRDAAKKGLIPRALEAIFNF